MLLATSLPNEADREAALAVIPYHGEIRQLAGMIAGALRNQSIDLIDIAVGTPHARAAIVALQEAADATVQAALELADSVVCERVAARSDIFDPLGHGGLLKPDEGLERMKTRVVRMPLEDCSIRLASAANHLVNAHLRLAWEANAATRADVEACGFDPDYQRGIRWASLEQFQRGLEALQRKPLQSVFPAFALNQAFDRFVQSPGVTEARALRDQIVHRDRPSYREAASFGRASLWSGEGFKVTFPPPDTDTDPDAPTIDERRRVLANAGAASVAYIEATWQLTIRWLRTVRVFITPGDNTISVTADLPVGTKGPVLPREQRDPGPFLSV